MKNAAQKNAIQTNAASKKRMASLARFAVAPAIVIVLMLSMGATSPNARYQGISRQLMCVCGCNEILANCDHVTCPDSPTELAELRADIGKGMSNHAIFAAFQDEYGPTVLASPMLTRFNIVAWVVPPALLLIGLLGVMALVKKWRLRSAAMPPEADVQGFEQLRSRIRKETDE